MMARVGVFAHHDYLDGMLMAIDDQPGVQAVPIGYTSLAELDALVREHSARLDGALAADRRVRRRIEELRPGLPAVHVAGMRGALVQTLLRLTIDGEDIARASIDGLARAEIASLYADLGVPAAHVTGAEDDDIAPVHDLIDLHLAHAYRTPGAIAITAEPEVRARLVAAGHDVRLVPPHAMSVQVALRRLLVGLSTVLASDAHVVVGLFEGPDIADLECEARTLGGRLLPGVADVHTVLLTYGPLLAATARFTSLPMLGRLADRSPHVHVGLGVAATAGEGLRQAAVALAGARDLGPVGAVLCETSGRQVILDVPLTGDTIDVIPPRLLAQRAGLSVDILTALRAALRAHDDKPLTSAEIGHLLGLGPREARRVIERLELVGLAEREGTDRSERAGRPRIRYRLQL